MRQQHAGFTLLELLMVIIIIAILVAIALPKFIQATEKAQAAQGLTWLGAIRSAELRYLGAGPSLSYTTSLADLDISVTVPPLYGSPDLSNISGSGSGATGFASLTHTGTSQTLGIQYGSGTICGSGSLAKSVNPNAAACAQD